MAIIKSRTKVYGINRVLKNLNNELSTIKTVTGQRLFACGLLVKNRSVKITPIKTGNLRGSSYVVLDETEPRPFAEIGYTANYAAYVHEMPAEYNYTMKGTGPKFLERALNDSRKEIVAYLSKKIV
jgi:hypothetical protein